MNSPLRSPLPWALSLALLFLGCSEPSELEPGSQPPTTDPRPTQDSPELAWEKLLGGPGSDWVQDLVATSDGGFAAAGYSDPKKNGRTMARIVRIDDQGKVLWDRIYGGERRDLASSVRCTSDGGFIVAGMTRSGGRAEDKGWLLRLDSSGESVWETHLGGEASDYLYSAIEASDGSIIAVGYTRSVGEGNEDLWLVRTSAEGEPIWQRSFGEALSDWGYGVAEADDGFRVVGASARDGIPDLDGWLLAVSPEGDLLWQRSLGGDYPDELLGIVRLASGDFAMAGYTTENPGTRTQFWIHLVAADGETRWERILGGPGDDLAMSIDAADDDRIFVTGGMTPEGTTAPDFWTLAFAADGEWLWQDRRGSELKDAAHGVAVLRDGKVAVGGYFRKDEPQEPNFWLLTLRSP